MSCMYCVLQRVFQSVAFSNIHISPLFVFYKYVINKFVYLHFSLQFIYLRYYILTFLTHLMEINNI